MKREEYVEDIVANLLHEFGELSEARRPIEGQWRLNMNFMKGNQYCEISPLGEVEDYGKQYFWQEREVYNHIAPLIETRLAKLGRVKASVSVRPYSSDDADINVAKLSTGVLKTIHEENNIGELILNSNIWSEVCGSVFYKVVWDEDKGLTIGQTKKKKIIKEGDISVIACPPHEIFPDKLTASSIDDCKFLIHAKVYSVEEVKDMFGIEVDGHSYDVFSVDSVISGGGLGYSASSGRMSQVSRDNSVLVLEKFERPTNEFPHGRHILVAGDKLVSEGDLPYITEKDGGYGLPFARRVALEDISNFYGQSVIERIIPLQRAYNGIKNKKHEFMNRIAMGVLAVEDGSVDTDNLEEEGLSPGKVLIYRQGCAPPRMLNLGSVPNEFIQEELRLESEFISISGVSEFMRNSGLPQNVTSGVAISMIQEQDDTRLSMSAESIRSAVKRVGQLILRLYKQFATTSRLKRVAGDNGDVQVIYFKGSDLTSDDLIFDTDNELNETPANRRSMVYELIRMGMFRDTDGNMDDRTRVKLLEMLGFGNWESARDIDECHMRRSERENLEMKEQDIMPIEYDNHELHIAEHTKAIINEKIDENYKFRLDGHIKAHQMLSFHNNTPISRTDETV